MQKALAMWLLLAAGGGTAQPDATPTHVVQTATDQVLQIVQDSELAAPISQERRRAEVQRIAADTLLALCSNVVFLVGAAAIMAWFSWPIFSAVVICASSPLTRMSTPAPPSGAVVCWPPAPVAVALARTVGASGC